MNCQDISRIVDTGSIKSLSPAERGGAESHALGCRDCAAIWGVQSRLAAVRVPATPPEVATRFQALAALPEFSRRRHSMRRLTLIGSLVVLAAAAALLAIRPESALEPHSGSPAVASAATNPARASAQAEVVSPAVTETAAPSADAPSSLQLPLVPTPAALPTDAGKTFLALQKAVERHPELVVGPELEGSLPFFVALTMRANGTVLNSAAELTTASTYNEISGRLQRMLPDEAGEPLVWVFTKGQQVSEGRALRARAMLFAAVIPDNFDLARTAVRVREILGHKYDELLVSYVSEESNRLTVFLSEDGRILREKVDHVTPQNADAVVGGGVGNSGQAAERIALTLGLNVEQIGRTGTTNLEQGGTWMVTNPDGTSRRESDARILDVLYAWERRTGEEPAIRAPVRTFEQEPDFNLAAALVVVERLLPDAFSHSPPSFAENSMRPTVVFTATGEVLRAGRVQIRYGVDSDLLLQQLVPGVHTRLHRSMRLTNKAGATAMVEFAWAE